jgi:F-type H+-transporting ATPase subunit epsilon
MSESTFLLEIVTPDGIVFSRPAEHVRLPGADGYFGVLPHHTPLMSSLSIGEIEINSEGKRHLLATSGGFVQVLPRKVIILAETAEKAGEIDRERAKAAAERARERLEKRPPELDETRARAALLRALNRLKVAE